MKQKDVEYTYSYDIKAELQIISGTNGSSSILYQHVNLDDPIHTSEQNLKQYGDNFTFNKKVTVDFDYYNDKANQYLTTYKTTNVTSLLIVTVSLKNDITFGEYNNNGDASTSVSLRIPLAVTITKPEIRGLSAANTGNKILVNQDYAKLKAFKTAVITLACVDAALLALLIIFIYASRNHDIKYSNKVNRIVRDYRSFIQRLLNNIDLSKYQILYIETIKELLEIRDTLQMPILLYENEDKTHAQFMIPTDGGTLYMFEVKVENYDEIYKEDNSNSEDTPLIEEPVQEEVVEESLKEEITETPNQEEQEQENTIVRHNYSFEARLIMSTSEVKDYYYAIVEYVKSFGVKIARSWSKERIYLGRKLFATIVYRGKTLSLALPLDPKEENYKKYHFKDMSEIKSYQELPDLLKITSDRKVKYAITLLEEIFIKEGLENKNHQVKVEKVKTNTKNALIKKGLIKLG